MVCGGGCELAYEDVYIFVRNALGMQLASGHAHWRKVWLTKHVMLAGTCYAICKCMANGQLMHSLANDDVLVSSLSILKVSLILP